MKLEQIAIFLELAKELHFWRTAEKVHLTQSALSRQIQALENELGFDLFIRNKRTVKLTTAGEFMRGEWQRMIEEIGNIHRQAKQISQGEIGTISIGHPGSIIYSFLPDLLAKIAAKYSALKFDLIEISALDLDQALLNYKIDIGFNRDLPRNEQLSSKLATQENLGVFVPKNHWLQGNKSVNLKNLSEEKFILPSMTGSSQYSEELKEIFEAHDLEPQAYIESDYGATILSLIARGLGISVMPASYADNLPKGVRFIELPYRTRLYAVWRKHDNNAVLQNVLALLKKSTASRS